jgi:hypothetical protein
MIYYNLILLLLLLLLLLIVIIIIIIKLGQTKDVLVYRLVTKSTIEERIVKRA